jgi:hypothetical protein
MTWPEDIACREVVELVSDYIEGALPPELCEALELHLLLCGGCTTYVEQMRTAIALTGRIAEEPLPAGLEDRLLQAFRMEQPA